LTNEKINALQKENDRLKQVKLELESNATTRLDEQYLAYQNRENLAKIEAQKDIAKINKDREIESLKLKNELEKEKLIQQKLQAQALLLQTKELQEAQNALNLKLYIIIFIAIIILIASFFTYFYYKRRREDKLRAYNDNLDKYFRAKENEARVKIAEKILDTVASGNLSTEHESRLIEVFNSRNSTSVDKRNLLFENSSDKEIQDAEIVDEKKI
jgi:predicted transport protein